MDMREISYLLRRASAHRAMARAACCPEARCIHRQFVKGYQHRLASIRQRLSPRSDPVPARLEACMAD